MSSIFKIRRNALTGLVSAAKLDALVIIHPANWYYLTGFTGESGALVVSADGATLITDGRFTVQAKEEAPGVRVELQKGSLHASTAEFLRETC